MELDCVGVVKVLLLFLLISGAASVLIGCWFAGRNPRTPEDDEEQRQSLNRWRARHRKK